MLLLVPSLSSADELPRPEIHGFVDVAATWNFNRPFDGASFTPNVGTTAKRANEFSLNLASLEASVAPNPVGFDLQLVFGTGTEIEHAGEPPGTAIGANAFKYVQRAQVTWKPGAFSLDAGILPSHIGFEGIAAKDNWLYTRAYISDYTPYYLTGVRAGYAFTDHLSAAVYLLNGFGIVGDDNSGKTLGTQLAWTSDKLALSWNTLLGPETPGDDDHWRFLGDVIATLNATPELSLTLQLDGAVQQRPGADAAAVEAVVLSARWQVAKKVALAARGEIFHDPDGVLAPVGQTMVDGTLCLELRPAAGLVVRIEGRYDHADADVFALHEVATFGDDQFLLALGMIAAF